MAQHCPKAPVKGGGNPRGEQGVAQEDGGHGLANVDEEHENPHFFAQHPQGVGEPQVAAAPGAEIHLANPPYHIGALDAAKTIADEQT